VPDVVPPSLLQNAVSLNSVMVNVARALGPAVVGALIASLDVGVCFLVNATSYLAVLAALWQMGTDRTDSPALLAHGASQVREGLRYVRGLPALWLPLAMMALIGTLAYEFQVVLPVLTTSGPGGDARTFGFLTAAMGAGAVAGGLGVAAFGRAGALPVVISASCFGIALLGAASARQVGAELAALVVVGVAGTVFQASATATLQLTTDPGFRDRVMALWSMTFVTRRPAAVPDPNLAHSPGTTPLGLKWSSSCPSSTVRT
jgi:MFS family permease